MGRIVAAFAYRCGNRVSEIQLGDSAAWARERGDFVWIGFHEPTEQDLRTLQQQFGLHELAIEDALHAHQVPKLEVYGESLFIVLRTARLGFRSIDALAERVIYRVLFPRGLTALDDLDERTTGSRPGPSHLTARHELMRLMQTLRLPLDERAQQRAAAHAEWIAARAKPLELDDVLAE